MMIGGLYGAFLFHVLVHVQWSQMRECPLQLNLASKNSAGYRDGLHAEQCHHEITFHID